jgi:hypothetical protein
MRGKIGKLIIKYSVLLVMIIALTATLAVPAMAQAPAAAVHSVQGTVNSVGASSFVVQNGSQTPVMVSTDGNTKYYMVPMGRVNNWVNNQVNKDIRQDKGKQTRVGAMRALHIPSNWKNNLGFLETFDVKAKFSNIETGDRVIARANANNLASQVMIIKAPVIQTIKGTTSTPNGNSITITPASGPAVTVTINAKTLVTLHGQLSVPQNQQAVLVYNKKTLIAQSLNVLPTAPAPTINNNPNPLPTLSSITVSAVSGNLTLGAGAIGLFTATGSYSNGSVINITGQANWASTNTGVANIINPGSVKGVAPGTTSITASKDGVTSPAVVLTVSP